MNHESIIREYLRERRGEEIVIESYPFITISREAGAGGRSLAMEILRRIEELYPGSFGTGWEIFDENLVHLIAKDASLHQPLSELVNEEYRANISASIGELILQRSEQFEFYKKIFEVIRILATIGKCIIVGRGGAVVAGTLPLGIHIRLVAPVEKRVKRMMELLGVDEAKARDTMMRQDESRRKLIRDFFSKDVADPMLYDAVFNTGRSDLSDIAEYAARAAKRKLDVYKTRLLQRNL